MLALVGRGLPNKQIARALGIREGTVKAHLTSVFQRIGVRDRTAAAPWARENVSPRPAPESSRRSAPSGSRLRAPGSPAGSFADCARTALGGWAGFSVAWLYLDFWMIVIGFEPVTGAKVL